MHQVRLIHWKAEEAEQRAEKLRAAGFEVAAGSFNAASLRALRETPPAAIVIDLSRLPSQGGDLAVNLRKTRATRAIPIVLVGGLPEKVDRIRALLPDAGYADWEDIGTAVREAIAHPPANPIVPDSLFAGYAGASLAKKLGIKENAVVALVGAPEGFEKLLGNLPAGTICRQDPEGLRDLTLWFPNSQQEMKQRVVAMGAYAVKGGLWVVWPKKQSGVDSDLSQPMVRKIGLDVGLVDFKVASIDATWTGLRFTRRKTKTGGAVMKVDPTQWRAVWAAVGVENFPEGLYEELVAAYQHPDRFYHNLAHLEECLEWLDAARAHAAHPEEVAMALWFHDAVYTPGASDNESRSATWARNVLTGAGVDQPLVERIVQLILITQHSTAPPDGDPALIADIDLAVLGANRARFERYEADVRKEYAAVPEAEYRSGRGEILRGFLDRPRLYQTEYFFGLLEARARENLSESLARLGD